MTAYVLIVETSARGGVAVKFANAVAARAWEDEHEMEINGTVVGCVPIVSRKEALRTSRLTY